MTGGTVPCPNGCCWPTLHLYWCWCGSKAGRRSEMVAAAVATLISPVRYRLVYEEIIGGPWCWHVHQGRTCPAEDQLLDRRRKSA